MEPAFLGERRAAILCAALVVWLMCLCLGWGVAQGQEGNLQPSLQGISNQVLQAATQTTNLTREVRALQLQVGQSLASGTSLSNSVSALHQSVSKLESSVRAQGNALNPVPDEVKALRGETKALRSQLDALATANKDQASSSSPLGWLNLILTVAALGLVGFVIWKGRSYLASQMPALSKELAKTFQAEIDAVKKSMADIDAKAKEAEERNAAFLKNLQASHDKALGAFQSNIDDQTSLLNQKLETARIEALSAKAVEAAGSLENLKAELTGVKERIDALNAGLATYSERLKVRDESIKASAWPAPFQDGGPLADWRRAIEERMGQSEPEAQALFRAVVNFNYLVSQQPPNPVFVGEALHNLSLEAYRFWKAGPWELLDATHLWSGTFQTILDRLLLPLDIKLVFAKDRFDMNTMLCADSSSENRISVKEPLSWIIWDKSGPAPRVLHHGLVTTC